MIVRRAQRIEIHRGLCLLLSASVVALGAGLLSAACAEADEKNVYQSETEDSVTPAPIEYAVYVRSETGVSVLGVRERRIYGVDVTTHNFKFSDDYAETWTDTGVASVAKPMQLSMHKGYQFLTTADGKILRNVIDQWAGWTNVSVSAPALNILARPDSLASNGTFLYFGNYNANVVDGAHVWRSGDNGLTWQEVLTIPAPAARHVHAVRVDPRNPADVFVSLGDVNSENGLYYSDRAGEAGSFRHLSENGPTSAHPVYGINFEFPAPRSGQPDVILLEGDGPDAPFIISYDRTKLSTNVPTPMQTQVLPPPSSTTSWLGTVLGIAITPGGDLYFQSAGEIGPHHAAWLVRAPSYSKPLFLELFDGPFGSGPYIPKTFAVGPYLFNHVSRIFISPPVASCQDAVIPPSIRSERVHCLTGDVPAPGPRGLEPGVFDPVIYLGVYDDLRAAFGLDPSAARDHWLHYGIGEGRLSSSSFDVKFYLSLHDDVSRAVGAANYAAALDHWVRYGIGEGRQASMTFDAPFYLKANSDLAGVFGERYDFALEHWSTYGLDEGRASSPVFDVGHYLRANPDLQAAFGALGYRRALAHWLHYGIGEGRPGSANFDARYYLDQNHDVAAVYGAKNYAGAIHHYLRWGRYEGRRGAP